MNNWRGARRVTTTFVPIRSRSLGISARKMDSLDINSTVQMKSGYSIPLLGYGECGKTLSLAYREKRNWLFPVFFHEERDPYLLKRLVGVYQTQVAHEVHAPRVPHLTTKKPSGSGGGGDRSDLVRETHDENNRSASSQNTPFVWVTDMSILPGPTATNVRRYRACCRRAFRETSSSSPPKFRPRISRTSRQGRRLMHRWQLRGCACSRHPQKTWSTADEGGQYLHRLVSASRPVRGHRGKDRCVAGFGRSRPRGQSAKHWCQQLRRSPSQCQLRVLGPAGNVVLMMNAGTGAVATRIVIVPPKDVQLTGPSTDHRRRLACSAWYGSPVASWIIPAVSKPPTEPS